MRGFNVLWRIIRNQTNNLVLFFSSRPLSTSSLGSMTLDRDDVEIAKEWLRNRAHWGNTELVAQYESEFARWNGSKYAFAFMGGRVALSACIYALGLQPGDEVILPGYTCVVVPNAFHYAGVKTVYCDIELDTYGLDVEQVKKRITQKTRAVLLHHLYGLVCRDYDAIIALAKEHGLNVIEDCAHATGAVYKDIKVGNKGAVAFYSSEQSKIFNTIQGGMAITNDEGLAKRLKEYYDKAPFPDDKQIEEQLCNVLLNYFQFKHPQRWILKDWAELRYGAKRLISTVKGEEMSIMPEHYGRKMPPPIAAIGINQLKKIDMYNSRRRDTAKIWDGWCDENGYKKPLVIDGSIPVFLRYPVLMEPCKKENVSWASKELNVVLGVWFSGKLHPVDKKIDNCPNADKAVLSCINFPGLTS
ncbi:MAG: DegT/DnrJ/EryC1/StrS family aminotransferase [Nitrospirota bacterium]